MPIVIKSVRRPMSDRRQLAGGAALAAVLSLSSQGAASAQDQACGVIADGAVVCAPDAGNYADGVSYVIEPEVREDLTIDLEDGTVIETPNQGLYVANLNGAVTINGPGAVVRTSGFEATGVTGVSNNGGVTINVQSVETLGAFSGGIAASARGGDVAISANQVITTGHYSAGVSASNVDDDIFIEVGRILTQGLFSDGIVAETATGDIHVRADLIDTVEDGSVAIRTLSESGSTLIEVNSIITEGFGADGVNAQSRDGDISVSANELITVNDAAFGAYLVSESGDLNVRADRVLTAGQEAIGVFAHTFYGQVAAAIGEVETRRDDAVGVFLSGGGGVTARIDKVLTSGAGSIGVQVTAGMTDPDLSRGDAVIDIGSVETRGYSSDAISVVAYGDINLRVEHSKTLGDLSYAVSSFSLDGDSVIRVVKAETEGYGAFGVAAGARLGHVDIAVQDVSTKGESASAIYGVSTMGDLDIALLGSARTLGGASHGILATGVNGHVNIVNAGSIVTEGVGSSGILAASRGTMSVETNAIKTSGRGSVGIDLVTAQAAVRTVSLKAAKVETSGDGAHGIRIANTDDLFVITEDGVETDYDITVEAGTISTTGEEADAIKIDGQGDVSVRAGNLSSAKATALNLKAVGLVDVELVGATTSGGSNAARLVGEDVNVAIAATGSLIGENNALVISAAAPGQLPGGPVVSPFEVGDGKGEARVNNAGRIVARNGAAVLVENGTIDLVNTGIIEGFVSFASGDDRFENKGEWSFTGDNEFGLGEDTLINSGVIRVAPAATAAIEANFYSLERLVNDGGLIELRNGVAGDVLTTDGDYEGKGAARIGLDIGDKAADLFVVQGAATGKTSLLLQGVGKNATLSQGAGQTLVRMGEGSASDAFSIANAEQGFVHYGLVYDAADREYVLVSRAGASVYRSAKIGDVVQGAWHEGGDAWASHRSALRAAGDTARPGQVWAQAYGGRFETDEAVSLDAGPASDLSYDADVFGGQSGVILAARPVWGGDLVVGATTGYAQLDADFLAASQTVEVQTLNVGAYADYQQGPAFVGLLVKSDWHSIDVDDAVAGYSEGLDGQSLGIRLDAGARFGSTLVFEPSAALDYVSTDIDALNALGQTVEFGDLEQLRGSVGGRLYGKRALGDGHALVISGGARVIHAFDGEQAARLISGGTSEDVVLEGERTWGEVEVGATVLISSGLAIYAEGTGAFGDNRSGGGLRLGARFSF